MICAHNDDCRACLRDLVAMLWSFTARPCCPGLVLHGMHLTTDAHCFCASVDALLQHAES